MTHSQSHTALAWREMSEAPLTGEEILAQWRGEESTVHGVILWDDKECRWYEGDNFVSPPDAWMPIPLPPGTEPPQSINSHDALQAENERLREQVKALEPDIAWLRTQAVSTAKAMTMLQDHRTADYKARGDLDANYKGVETHETREWQLAEKLSALLTRDKTE